jgi:hypothetical protein
MWLYHFLDYFFLVFHLFIVLFNLFGWIWGKTRKANLILLLLTAGSWFGLGLIYGIGFCPFTEWHWQVLAKLGSWPTESSYIQYVLRRIFGLHISSAIVDAATLLSFCLSFIISLILNILQYKTSKSKRRLKRNIH